MLKVAKLVGWLLAGAFFSLALLILLSGEQNGATVVIGHQHLNGVPRALAGAAAAMVGLLAAFAGLAGSGLAVAGTFGLVGMMLFGIAIPFLLPVLVIAGLAFYAIHRRRSRQDARTP